MFARSLEGARSSFVWSILQEEAPLPMQKRGARRGKLALNIQLSPDLLLRVALRYLCFDLFDDRSGARRVVRELHRELTAT